MSVFSGSTGQSIGSEMLSKECKRDFEGEITRIKNSLSSSSLLLSSLNAYLDSHGKYYNEQGVFTLPSLYGMLALEIRALDENLKRIQDDWQREIDRLEKNP